ncbi:GTPase Era [Actinomyces sp. Marseille-P3109]|uniref:GTPase Era n=1 Tax=Actinomyces sp. Marseille-P3109 TaxID=2083009 RepID=UPI000D55FC84|nr:GTPase Era [Actinomyces sp. Marseille-P3109]
MTDTADHTDPAARDDQPQVPTDAFKEASTEPLEMPEPGPAPAGFRFPTDAELMDGPNPLTDPDEEEADDEGETENDEADDEPDGSDVAVLLDADGFPILNEDGDADETAGTADTADSTRVEITVPDFPEDFRAGFACIVGRPNAGKSTLTNALVGAKIAITSGRPQTTRHNVRGVIHKDKAQIVLVDTPGLHRPRTLLGKRLNDLVRETLTDVDVVVFCIPANEKIGPGDRFITRDLAELRTPVVAVVTKADTVTREALAAQLLAVSELGEWADIVPVSAQRNEQIDVLEEVLLKHMPLSPPLYPTGEITDEPQQVMIAELVREAALEGVRDELPHSLAVVVDEIADPDDEREVGRIKGVGGRLQVRVSLVVERDSQKAIIIGRGGRRLKEVGVNARKGIEELLGRKVYLDLHVRTAKDWQSDPKALARLGF